MLTCSFCTIDFINKAELNHHIKNAHIVTILVNGIPKIKYKCPKCGSTHARKNLLKAHMESQHFGKPVKIAILKCAFCPDLSFNTYDLLLDHQRTIHNVNSPNYGLFHKISSALSDAIQQYMATLKTENGEPVVDFNVLKLQKRIFKDLVNLLQHKVKYTVFKPTNYMY